MPAAIHLRAPPGQQQAKVRKAKNSKLPWLRPDAKSQVTLRYEDGKATAIDAVVLSTQHDPDVKLGRPGRGRARAHHQAGAAGRKSGSHKGTKFHINPTGKS